MYSCGTCFSEEEKEEGEEGEEEEEERGCIVVHCIVLYFIQNGLSVLG